MQRSSLRAVTHVMRRITIMKAVQSQHRSSVGPLPWNTTNKKAITRHIYNRPVKYIFKKSILVGLENKDTAQNLWLLLCKSQK